MNTKMKDIRTKITITLAVVAGMTLGSCSEDFLDVASRTGSLIKTTKSGKSLKTSIFSDFYFVRNSRNRQNIAVCGVQIGNSPRKINFVPD